MTERMVKCKDCKFVGENYITSFQGQGIYKFWYCSYLIHDLKMVEPELPRECEWFEKRRLTKP